MTKEQAESEKRYVLARCIYLELYRKNIIDRNGLQNALREAANKYKSISGELEVNSIAGENDYTNRSYQIGNSKYNKET